MTTDHSPDYTALAVSIAELNITLKEGLREVRESIDKLSSKSDGHDNLLAQHEVKIQLLQQAQDRSEEAAKAASKRRMTPVDWVKAVATSLGGMVSIGAIVMGAAWLLKVINGG